MNQATAAAQKRPHAGRGAGLPASDSDHPENDQGPLGPYYSTGFTEVQGVFYATQQRDWDWREDGVFTGPGRHRLLPGSRRNLPVCGRVLRRTARQPYIHRRGSSGQHVPDGYVYAIGTPREFNASSLVLGSVRPCIQNITNPARWQCFTGLADRLRSTFRRTPPACLGDRSSPIGEDARGRPSPRSSPLTGRRERPSDRGTAGFPQGQPSTIPPAP
jgi:hypothetical protein